jgi:hypothetical protein
MARCGAVVHHTTSHVQVTLSYLQEVLWQSCTSILITVLILALAFVQAHGATPTPDLSGTWSICFDWNSRCPVSDVDTHCVFCGSERLGCDTFINTCPPVGPFCLGSSIQVQQIGTSLTYSDEQPCGSGAVCTDMLSGSVNGNSVALVFQQQITPNASTGNVGYELSTHNISGTVVSTTPQQIVIEGINDPFVYELHLSTTDGCRTRDLTATYPPGTVRITISPAPQPQCPERKVVYVDFPVLNPYTFLTEHKPYSIWIQQATIPFTTVTPVSSSSCTLTAEGTRLIYLIPFISDARGVPGVPSILTGTATFNVELNLRPDVMPPLVQCNYHTINGDPSQGKECFHQGDSVSPNTPTSDKNSVAQWKADVLIQDIFGRFSSDYNRTFWVNMAELGITSSTSLEDTVTKVELFIERQNFKHLSGIYPIAWAADPPSDLLVTDPNGQRTGLLDGQLLTEIPGSTYITHEDNTAIAIIAPPDGFYKVQVIGTPGDDFSLVSGF